MIKCSAISRSISSLVGRETTLAHISSKLFSNQFGAILVLFSTKALNLADDLDVSLTAITSPTLTVKDGISTFLPFKVK